MIMNWQQRLFNMVAIVSFHYESCPCVEAITGCVLVYRYTKERNTNELRHNSMYGYENNRNSPVYRNTRTAPDYVYMINQLDHSIRLLLSSSYPSQSII